MLSSLQVPVDGEHPSTLLLLLPTSFALDILEARPGGTTPSLSLQASRSCAAPNTFDKTVLVKGFCRREKTFKKLSFRCDLCAEG